MIPKHMNPCSRPRKAVSMVEVVVSTVFVGLVLAASMQTLATVSNTRARTADLLAGPSLTRDLLSEILQAAYQDPQNPSSAIGPDLGESSSDRSRFDDVDDYDGWSESIAVTADGTDLGIGAGWTRQVAVSYVDAGALTPSAGDTGLKRITVTATPTSGVAVVMEALRSSRGALQRPPHADRTIVAGARVSIEMEAGTTAEAVTVLTKNHSVDD